MQSTLALSNVTSWFPHRFDPIDDVEHYLQDHIVMHQYCSPPSATPTTQQASR
ncbi:hypothetical protein PC129_g14940 [Phytophthora cactorum]|nr:hypothetical protein Pcac1_g11668 [Phytophthora cactorum]KAG2882524.1 hypothetical protein PC114_g20998 [Phytophthora cactorum]KAG2899678.1 hypothetical protein PC117_g22171 [Phytophthora cactorum]KAG2974741.1 hypothetical protein PC119_g22605 [Phytophthora cactorum]KAG3002002.1 hypothetical protein PC120_g19945 [Phytophthora cactorum]